MQSTTWGHFGVPQQHAELTVAIAILSLADDIEKSSMEVKIDTNNFFSGFKALDGTGRPYKKRIHFR